MIIYDDFNRISPPRETRVPEDRRARNPLIDAAGFRNFLRMKQHPHAPKWNFETGDRVNQADLEGYRQFGKTFEAVIGNDCPPAWLMPWIKDLRPRVLSFQKQVPEGLDIGRNWATISTLNREDLLARVEILVPLDADLERLIVYDTSGSTGHALVSPHHPGALAKSMRMVEFVLSRFGLAMDFGPDMTACLNVGVQANTVVFPNVFSVWNQAGFAKINLDQEYWRDPEDAQAYLDATAPAFLTGDPLGFAEMLRRGIGCRTGALLSTAMAMPRSLRERLEKRFQCPVIDWYSTTETGPIGYTCRLNQGFHILPRDLYVEILDPDGKGLPVGEKGEITVSGGRNPYLPLLRYRTGDHGRMDAAPCPCGDRMPRIVDLQGRAPVVYLNLDGKLVNPVDIGRLLRSEVMARHLVVQHPDRSLDVYIQPVFSGHEPDGAKIRDKLTLLFGKHAEIRVHIETDPQKHFSGPDFSAYKSEFTMEDFL